MKKTIYLIRHSSPFIEIDNYSDYNNVSWHDYNRNMILSVLGEKKASELIKIDELNGIKDIYSSDSFRAIATAKYLSEANNTKIKLDERINERDFGVDYLNQLPDDFTKKSFDDKNFKVFNGESLNDMDKRFNDFIEELLNSDKDKSIIVIHGIMLLSFFQNNCDFEYDENTITVKYNNKTTVENKPKSPGVYKITYVDKKIIDIDVIN
ncbi:MAG: histidine phosphatase family protein [Bacilli bacterium]|nr:histidine phosphatase family protein [Bacilli bacterium]